MLAGTQTSTPWRSWSGCIRMESGGTAIARALCGSVGSAKPALLLARSPGLWIVQGAVAENLDFQPHLLIMKCHCNSQM